MTAKTRKESTPASMAAAVRNIVGKDAFDAMGKLSDTQFRKLEDSMSKPQPTPRAQSVNASENSATANKPEHTPTPYHLFVSPTGVTYLKDKHGRASRGLKHSLAIKKGLVKSNG